MSEKKGHWIKGAINPAHKGDFREKAERAGKSTLAYAHEHDKGDSHLAHQARLAETMIEHNKGHKKKNVSHKSIMKSMYG